MFRRTHRLSHSSSMIVLGRALVVMERERGGKAWCWWVVYREGWLVGEGGGA